MAGLNTKVNDCKLSIGWHGVCLSKEQGEHENDTLAHMLKLQRTTTVF